jgi:hypothetical protein
VRPLLYLATRRFVNALKRVPKNPRLLMPALFFLLAFAGPAASFLFAHRDAVPPTEASPFTPRELTEGGPGVLVAAIRGLLLFSVIGSITAALGESRLFFSPSDVDFLFPAPLRRRAVLLFKMLGTYLGLFFPVIYFPILLGGRVAAQAGLTPAAYWPGMLGAWLFLVATTNLTQFLLFARPPDNGGGDDTRRARRERARKTLVWLVTGLLFVGAVVLYQAVSTEGLRAIRTPLRAVNSEAASLLLFPVAWASDLFLVAFTGWSGAAAAKLAGLALIAALSLAALFGRDRDFYEGAMEFSSRHGQALAAARRGDATTLLTQMAQEGKLPRGGGVRPFGGGTRSLVWKDLVITTRTPLRSWLTLLFIAAVPALLGRGIGGRGGGAEGVVFWTVFFTINLSNVFLISIRTMLKRADITKALPIPPARFLFAENALSVALLTALGWLSLGLMTLLGAQRGPLVTVAFLCLPSLAALILLTQTSFVLLYPNRDDQAQNTIGGLLGLFATTLALAPSLALGAVLHLTGASALVLGLAVTAANLVAAGAALAFAAFLWQRFDPTD